MTFIVMITAKRIYDYIKEEKANKDSSNNDVFRILVDKLWPRGISKDRIKIDLWLKEIAPSNGLRKWFAHDPKKWENFRIKYKEEIMRDPKKIEILRQIKHIEKERGSVVLMYAAKDQKHNNAVALNEFLDEFSHADVNAI